MPGYVSKSLHMFQQMQPNQPQHDPHDWTVPAFG